MKKSALTLHRDEPAKAGVWRIASALIDGALRPPGDDPVADGHFLRTTTKRLRALLRLIRPAIGKGVFERENARLKRAASRLASSRDRAVAARTFQALAASAASRHSRRASNETAAGATRRAMRLAARDLAQSRRSFQRMRIVSAGWEAFGPGLARVYRAARRRMQAAYAHPTDRAFHRWRIRLKQLGYQLEWLAEVWPKRFATMLKHLHQLEKKLGADHDLVVLRSMLETAPAWSDDADLIGQVKKSAVRKSQQLRRDSRPLGAKAFGEKPGRFGRQCRRHWQAWPKRK